MPKRSGGGGSRRSRGRGHHLSYNEAGELCMAVVDPVTRKLMIPVSYVYETRAQQRNTLPSLCQLFLSDRCRQGENCYQVHANWEVVEQLRREVDALPYCCVRHGDLDRAGVRLGPVEFAAFTSTLPPVASLGDSGASLSSCSTNSGEDSQGDEAARCLMDVVLYLPNCGAGTLDGKGHIALEDVSYTAALKKLLEEQNPLRTTTSAASPPKANATRCRRIALLNARTGVVEGKKTVLDGTGCTVCRLHALDRCRYAEECKFLHLCKAITAANPMLTAGGGGGSAAAAATTTTTAVAEPASEATRPPGYERETGVGPYRSSGDLSQGNNHSGQSVFMTISHQQQHERMQRLRAAATDSNRVGIHSTSHSELPSFSASSAFLPDSVNACPSGSFDVMSHSFNSYSHYGNSAQYPTTHDPSYDPVNGDEVCADAEMPDAAPVATLTGAEASTVLYRPALLVPLREEAVSSHSTPTPALKKPSTNRVRVVVNRYQHDSANHGDVVTEQRTLVLSSSSSSFSHHRTWKHRPYGCITITPFSLGEAAP